MKRPLLAIFQRFVVIANTCKVRFTSANRCHFVAGNRTSAGRHGFGKGERQ